MAVAPSSRYTVVRGLARGLQVLRALNERSAGGWSPSELSEELNIHRTTLKRLCETLRDLHYVSLDTATGRYSLAPSIRGLAAGYRGGAADHAGTD